MLFSDTHSEKKKGKGEDDIEGHIADNDAVLHGQGADNAGNADKFEPIILPMTRACSFFLVAAMAEASSGKLVPTATMVSPMMMSLIPMNVAMPTAPQISRRELAISKIKPARSQNTAFFIGIISGSSCFWCKTS